jgi:ribosomal protein S18 acetylase RimI-like enzyme
MMFIRTASERDLASIRALLVETWHAAYDAIYGAQRVSEIIDDRHSIASLKTCLAKLSSEFLVADDGKEIGGMAFASADASGKTVTLHQLCVSPKHQGRGIGGLLLDEVIDSFPDAGLIRLEVEPANLQAVAFYEANGFVAAGLTPDRSSGAETAALIMERRL